MLMRFCKIAHEKLKLSIVYIQYEKTTKKVASGPASCRGIG